MADIEFRIPNREGNLGKYDEESSALVKRYRATAAVVIVIGGTKGIGFSVSTVSQDLLRDLPVILRCVADNIECEQKSSS